MSMQGFRTCACDTITSCAVPRAATALLTARAAPRRQMLSYVKSAVTRNQSEKKINSLLDHVAQSTDMDLLQEFYETTLKVGRGSLRTCHAWV